MTRRTLVLASTSRWRRAQLERLGLRFVVADPAVDEAEAKARFDSVPELVEHLARAKARAVASAHPDALIIGGDQSAEIDGVELGKPGTVDRAVDQLMRLQGRTHRLWTALCVLDSATGVERTHVDETALTMRPLTRARAQRYVELDDPVSCAGSYRIEATGPALFTVIEGSDPTAIEGLPLVRLCGLLRAAGMDPLDEADP